MGKKDSSITVVQQSNQDVASKKGLLRSTSIVSALTLLSRVLGLVRDIVIAQVFGASPAMDAFLIAFRIPNFFRRLFAEGAFSQAFVPVISEYIKKRPHEEVQRLVNHAAGTLGGILLAMTAVAMVFSPWIVMVFAPGFAQVESKMLLAGDLLLVTFPYLFFISMTAFAGGVLNSKGHFATPAFAPTLLNICSIAAALWFGRYFEAPIMAQAWAVSISGVLQLLIQFPALKRIHLFPKPQWGWRDEGVQRVLRLMLPALFGVSVSQINMLIGSMMASFLPHGSVTWIYYADRLMELPLGVFGVAVGTVLLPSLSKHYANHDSQAYSAGLDWGLRSVLLVGCPAALGLLYLGEPILFSLFQGGAFSARDVHMTDLCLKAYSVAVLGFIILKVILPAYFARQDTKTPVKVAVIALLTNIILNLALIRFLAHVGLALSTSIAAVVNVSLLYFGLVRSGAYKPCDQWHLWWTQIILACVAMVLVIHWITPATDYWMAATRINRLMALAAIMMAAVITYGMVLFATGVRRQNFTKMGA